MKKKIGIIGGSGLEDPQLFNRKEEIYLETPYGFPSSTLLAGEIKGVEAILLSRHGRQHEIPPTQVNNRANIFALKEMGCSHLLATTACGSLREDIHRGDLVIADQFIDFTRHRVNTFYDHFEHGDLKHFPMADPFDRYLREMLVKTAGQLGLSCHDHGTIITIEGPRFSTRAESKMFRNWGADIINMSIAPEAALANEAGIPYAVVAMSTDYDSWREDEDAVAWKDVLRVFEENVHHVINLLLEAIPVI
ncbi:MAG: S-methyl-5'-thioadenosine phosphorylase [Chlorobi bacterium]|nr:S-methyl-5'-thioadenosine phosphorylase [Chlorobiota bacterium]